MTATRSGEGRKLYETLGILQMVGDGLGVFFRPPGRPRLKTANLFLPSYIKFSKNWLLLYCFHPETSFVVNLYFYNGDSRGLS